MNKSEFKQALEIAKSDEQTGDIPNCMRGCALKGFQPCCVTLNNVAALIRYQAAYMFGGWSADEINSVASIGRKNFLIIG